jgi:hypothetical protein
LPKLPTADLCNSFSLITMLQTRLWWQGFWSKKILHRYSVTSMALGSFNSCVLPYFPDLVSLIEPCNVLWNNQFHNWLSGHTL